MTKGGKRRDTGGPQRVEEKPSPVSGRQIVQDTRAVCMAGRQRGLCAGGLIKVFESRAGSAWPLKKCARILSRKRKFLKAFGTGGGYMDK